MARRVTTFDEVTGGLDESIALFEAAAACPAATASGATTASASARTTRVKLADGSYEIDHDYCKGCGMCVTECPAGAIEMEPEPS